MEIGMKFARRECARQETGHNYNDELSLSVSAPVDELRKSTNHN